MCVNHHLSNLPKRGPGLNPDTRGLHETHVEGKDVIIVDDLVDTAGSMQQAVKVLKSCGAKDVYLSLVILSTLF